jgi:hypothetical protein
MPSVFTIEGTDVGTPRRRKRAKRAKSDLGDAAPQVGDCKTVKNPRTGCSMQLCYVGKAKSRTGWKFKKGSSHCPRR